MLHLTFCCSFFPPSFLHIFLMWFYSPNINHACGGSALQTASSLCHTRSPWLFGGASTQSSAAIVEVVLYTLANTSYSLSTHKGLCAEKAFCCSHCIFRVYLNSCWQTFCFSFCEKQSTQKWQIICANHWAIPLFMQRGFGWSFLQTEAVWDVL